MLYNIQNAWCLFCLFCDYWFEIINYNMQYIYTCATNVLHVNQRWLPFLIVGSSVGCPLSCPLFHYLKVMGCPLSCPLYPYMELVGSLICMAKLPWAAHSTAHWAAHFFIYGSSGQPNLHGKIPMGSPRAAHSVAHVQPMGSEVGSSRFFFSYGHPLYYGFHHIWDFRESNKTIAI